MLSDFMTSLNFVVVRSMLLPCMSIMYGGSPRNLICINDTFPSLKFPMSSDSISNPKAIIFGVLLIILSNNA